MDQGGRRLTKTPRLFCSSNGKTPLAVVISARKIPARMTGALKFGMLSILLQDLALFQIRIRANESSLTIESEKFRPSLSVA